MDINQNQKVSARSKTYRRKLFLARIIKIDIKTKMDDDEIEFSSDSMDFEGDLTFNDESDE